MSDFTERRPAHRPPAGDTGGDSVHQVVFRWDGNQGRQGTGMKAVAYSCPPERAEELGRELGPLLWVSGAAAPRPSVVRTVSRDGEVMLVQRWPTTDRGGRPSTVSHVLIGERGTLKTRQCLGLAYGGWGSHRESVEQAVGQLRPVACEDLDALARQSLPEMVERLATVQHSLVLVTAEWLRDPARRISLLTEEKEPPDRDAAALVYLGLFLLFGSWLGHEWTFATYDTVDSHPLRLMCVPRWEPDTGGPGPLARIMVRTPAQAEFAHKAAHRLVEHLLAHPPNSPGLPQLVDRLPNGATLDWPRRQALLNDVLSADRPPTSAPASTSASTRVPPPAQETAAVRGTSPVRARETRETPPPAQETRPPLREAPPVRDTPPPVREAPPHTAPEPPPAAAAAAAAAAAHEPPAVPAPAVVPAPPIVPGRPADDARTPTARPVPSAVEVATVREELRRPLRRNDPRYDQLKQRLRDLPDEALLDVLRSGGLPPEPLGLLLEELGDARRVRERRPQVQHDLCRVVLDKGLYFEPRGLDTDSMSRLAMARRAAELYLWAVAPLTRDARYLSDLRELLHRMCRDRHPAAGNWLWDSIIVPANGVAPDLPPGLWQQIVRDVHQKTLAPATTTPAAGDRSPAPAPTSAAPDPPAFGSRFNELTSSLGCVVGTGVGVILVLLTIVLIFA
ncbi:hypothetical protein AB0G35_03425 [Streptomyces sp. NPDC021749]|uniref:hypothetical protein n=1 Tax=Streptomyces sp. NPDC021749 TaxID=3154905 RepID=UPI0033F25185